MKCNIIRVAQGKNSTLSHLYLNGIFQCYLLEDKIRDVKIPKQTAISTGVYRLIVNTWGGMNVKYQNLFPAMHKGMIEIDGIPSFHYVYIHMGNTIAHTAGCPLCGLGFVFENGDYSVIQSKEAYKIIYPKLFTVANSTFNQITIENNFQF
ncbi:MAG TPA: hypothetical protein DCL43_11210 [Chitinophagaceae bacterium]|nr:hypothetical protein [Chitinophagaceae bacterium]